jgi:magnesium transporter
MHGTVTSQGKTAAATRSAIEADQQSGTFFWLDLDGVDDEAQDVLLQVLGIHHLAVNDVQNFGQRPKIDDYDDFTYLVLHGANADGNSTAEVHLIVAEKFLVTVTRGECPALAEAHARVGHPRPSALAAPQIALIYVIIDQLVDSFFPVLSTVDNQIDDLEDAILVQPTEAQLGQIFTMKRTLITMRKVVTPQRDMFASIASGVTELPGVNDESLRYMRDVYDHLIRVSDLIDEDRDLLSGVMDTHISTVSNRLNVVMKQLTIIATVFLPLSFLTGFFGQNFGWMVTRITGLWQFAVFGLGVELVSAAFLVYLFRKRGWLGGPTD